VIIVGGEFEVAPDQREAFLAGRHESMRTSRAEPGCLEYTFSADPLDPSRVLLFEKWEDQSSLDAHLAALSSAPPPPAGSVAPLSATLTFFDAQPQG
jgi:quinol monooxygenase YgiN